MLDPSVYSDTAVPWLPDSRLRDRYLTWVPRPCVPKETGSQLADVTPTHPEVGETGFWSARVDRRFPNCTIPYVKYIVTMHTVCQHCVSSHSAYNMRVINEYLDTQEEENTGLTHLRNEHAAAWCARAGLRFEGGTGKTDFTLLAASANVENQS